MVTKIMRGHNGRNSLEQKATYEVLIQANPKLGSFKDESYKQHSLTKPLATATGTCRTSDREDGGRTSARNVRIPVPEDMIPCTASQQYGNNGLCNWTRGKVGSVPSIKYTLLCVLQLRAVFEISVQPKLGRHGSFCGLGRPCKVASIALLISSPFRLRSQETLVGQEQFRKILFHLQFTEFSSRQFVNEWSIQSFRLSGEEKLTEIQKR